MSRKSDDKADEADDVTAKPSVSSEPDEQRYSYNSDRLGVVDEYGTFLRDAEVATEETMDLDNARMSCFLLDSYSLEIMTSLYVGLPTASRFAKALGRSKNFREELLMATQARCQPVLCIHVF